MSGRSLVALAAAAIIGLVGLVGSSGCTTDAFCLGCSDAFTSAGTPGNSGATGAGGGALSSSGAGIGGQIFAGGTGGSTSTSTTTSGGSCTPTNGGIEVCDGVDNDCNGKVDDGVDYGNPKSCGTCANDCYAQLLNNDPKSITCVPSASPGAVAGTCKGKCAADYWDLKGSGSCDYYCVKTSPGDATCNFLDDDCDGLVDEDVDLCHSTTDCGKCGNNCVVLHGTPTCHHPAAGACDASNTACAIASCACTGPNDCWYDLDHSYATGCEYPCYPTHGGVEICDGLDNDCNGTIDDGVAQTDPKVGQTCFGSPKGECGAAAHAGTTVCLSAKVSCAGANLLQPGEAPELCNGLDDDCNGVVDDNPTDAGGACGPSNIYPCSRGTYHCQVGALVCVGSVDPKPEVCNGVDDDCDGNIDLTGSTPPPDSVGVCGTPVAPPAGATSPCKAGAKACVGGVVACQGAVGPASGAVDGCGVDANCDGALTNQPDVASDVHNCGACGNDCYAGSVHAIWSCQSGACAFQSCQTGYWDLSGTHKCAYPCTFVSAKEACNGVDDNCNGQIDEGVPAPSPVQVCGISPSATAAECTSGVTVACVNGSWSCTFPANVCSPTCKAATEICDTLDNNCNGLVNETIANYGKPCASDDGKPAPGDGACRTTGTYVCASASAAKCSAAKNLAAAGPELCDGIDNDCDGAVDEPFSAKGMNATYFVQPAVTKVGASIWIMSYEASRPSAGAVSPGTGNGYVCTAYDAADPSCNDTTIPVAPAGVTLDKTVACSVQGKIPWFNVSPIEAEQTCKARGGSLCATTDWQTACQATSTCSWGYAPRGAACTSAFVAGTKFCNLGLSYDFDPNTAGAQSGLLVTGSPVLQECWADWSALQGNAVGKVYDITGNLREITKSASNVYPLMGGSFGAQNESGSACGFTFYAVNKSFELYDLGFRCCFSSDPTK